MMLLSAGVAPPAFASYYYETVTVQLPLPPPRPPEPDEPPFPPRPPFIPYQMFPAVSCDDDIKKSSNWQTLYLDSDFRLHREAFVMPARGTFDPGPPDSAAARVGRRVSDGIVELEVSADFPPGRYDYGGRMTGKATVPIKEGMPSDVSLKDACGKKRFTPAQKTAFRQQKTTFEGCAGVLTLGAVVTVEVPPVAAVLGGGASGCWLWSYLLGQAIDDPPDPEFRTIAKPAQPRVRHVRARGRLGRRGARAVSRLLDAQAKNVSLHRALLTAIERAQGAVVYGTPADAQWEREQMLAAARYARSLADALDQLRSRSVRAVGALKAAGIRSKVSRGDALRAQKRIAQRGLPQALIRRAKGLGMDQAALESLRRDIAQAKPGALTARLPDALASRKLLGAVEREARTMRDFATRVQQDPVAPVG